MRIDATLLLSGQTAAKDPAITARGIQPLDLKSFRQAPAERVGVLACPKWT